MEGKRLTLIGRCAEPHCLRVTGDVFKGTWPLAEGESETDYITSVPNADGTKTFLYCPKHRKEHSE